MMIELSPGLFGRIQEAPAADAPTLFWVHGYTLDSSSWLPVWAQLPDYRHIGVDLLGHGRSDDLPKSITMPEMGATLADVALAHGATHLVGLSFGGQVALQMAIEHPYAFQTITLGAPGRGGAVLDKEIAQTYAKLYMLYYMAGQFTPSMKQTWIDCKIFNGCDRVPGLRDDLWRQIAQHSWREFGSGAMAKVTRHTQSTADVAHITARTRILVGDREMPAFKQIAETLTTEIPNCETLPLTGDIEHLCMLQNVDMTVAAIMEQVGASKQVLELIGV